MRHAIRLAGLFLLVSANTAFSAEDLKKPAKSTRVHEVPEHHATIQQAIDAAADGDTVRVAPGVYHEQLRLSGKTVHLTSWYESTNDRSYIRRTIIDGSIHPDPDPEDDIVAMHPYAIIVEPDAGADTTVLGFTIRDADDGIACHAKIRILFNYFVNNVDAIDYEDGGGICRFNTFVANDDDGVDIDNSSEVTVTDNDIRDNDNDGIEIRCHAYTGKPLRNVIRNNRITGNGEDGIQIIGYANDSDRIFIIERNIIAQNAMAGIGCMSLENSDENYEGASLNERMVIANNTFVENQYGMTGGDNAQLINNIFLRHQFAALKKVDGKSTITRNVCWQNGMKPIECNLAEDSIVNVDPKLDESYAPREASASLDGGTVQIDLHETAQLIVPDSFLGRAPDIGAIESN